MRNVTLVTFVFAALLAVDPAIATPPVDNKVWHPGSEDCTGNPGPPIDVWRADAITYVLRQNKCVNAEAPFIYLLFGDHSVLVVDTGATADPTRFPLYDTVQGLIGERQRAQPGEKLRTLVVHSHSHSDHTAGDAQFRGKPGVTLVEPTGEAVRKYFGFSRWPEGSASIELGARTVAVLPTPGHQDESLALHDPHTGWLLTSDSIYPGRLVVKDWAAYRASIQRLAEFSRSRPVSALMGTHIEMSSTGQLFPFGGSYQPNEARLSLPVAELWRLDEALRQAGAQAKALILPSFVVEPLGLVARTLSGLLKALGVR